MASFWQRLLYTDITGGRLRAFPELARFGDAKAQHEAYKTAESAVSEQRSSPTTIVGSVVGIVASVFMVFTDFGAEVLMIGLGALVTLSYALHRASRKHIRRELRRLHEELAIYCECCDYLLLGNRTGRCPECGTAIPEGQRVRIVMAGTECEPNSA